MYERWLSQEMEDPDLAEELRQIQGNEKEIYERFYRELEFGTGGMRGILGAGTNRMNIYTVRKVTQGMANYLLAHYENPAVAISYDSRNKSQLFAREAACVLAANHVQAHLYRELMPTPALSYAVRQLGCQAGIMVTASHNPAQYNGYKAYGADGCQMVSQIADEVYEEVTRLDIFEDIRYLPFDQALASGRISYIPNSLIDQYLTQVLAQQVNRGVGPRSGLKVVYTPLNGAGNRCVRTVLGLMGLQQVWVVPQQEEPDGNFPTCPYPNPEIREAMELGIQLARQKEADILIATDPDCDRVGCAVRHQGEYQLLTGNEVGVLLLDYIARSRRQAGTMPPSPIVVKSIVSTTMIEPVAKEYGVEVVDVLTGFKYIGEQIGQLEAKGEENRYLLGFEESYGYLTGTYVRDKDGVNGASMIAEMAAYYRLENKTLVDVLEELYAKYGYYYNSIDNFAFEGAQGMARMKEMMEQARENPPKELAGYQVVQVADYGRSVRTGPQGEQPISLPRSNVLAYTLENGATVVIRPSGTEPKLKAYYSLKGENRERCQCLRQEISTAVVKMLGI